MVEIRRRNHRKGERYPGLGIFSDMGEEDKRLSMTRRTFVGTVTSAYLRIQGVLVKNGDSSPRPNSARFLSTF